MTPNSLQKIVIGFIPFNADPANPVSRFRCQNPIFLLRSIGLQIYQVDFHAAQNCDIIIFGNYSETRLESTIEQISHLQNLGIKCILDIADDLISIKTNQLQQNTLKNQLSKVCDTADLISVSSSALEERYKNLTNTPIIQTEDVIDSIFQNQPPLIYDKKINLEWVGYKNNLADLLAIKDDINSFLETHRSASFKIVTSKQNSNLSPTNQHLINQHFPKAIFEEWQLNQINREISQPTIALLPVNPVKAKSPNKLLEYGLKGFIPLATKTLDHSRILKDNSKLNLVKETDSWLPHLEALANDVSQLIDLSSSTQAYFQNKFTKKYFVDSWLKLLQAAMDTPSKRITLTPSKKPQSFLKILFESRIKQQFKILHLTCNTGVYLYGAGQHTKWLLKILQNLTEKPEILGIIDDFVDYSKIGKIDIITIQQALKNTPIVLSSDIHQEVMKQKLLKQAIKQKSIIDLYEDLPLGPYEKN